MSRITTTTLLACLLLVSVAPAAPDAEDVKKALATLRADSREASPRAIALLAKEGGRESLDAIALFGAKTRYPKHIVIAAKALVAADPKGAGKRIQKLIRNFKKFGPIMARLATMAEQVPGASGHALLAALAKDRRDRVAATAVRALGERREEAARAQLSSLVKSKRSQVASAAAHALSRLKPDNATMELLFLRAQKGRKARIGDACALALTRIEGAEVFGNRALKMMITSGTRDSFHALAKLVLRLEYEPDPALLEKAFRSPVDPVREMAYDLIGQHKIQGYAERLLRQANAETNWRNSVAAWLSLKRSGIQGAASGIALNIAKTREPAYWAIQCAGADPQDSLIDPLFDAALDTKDAVRSELAQRSLNAYTEKHAEFRKRYVAAFDKYHGKRRGRLALLGIANIKANSSFDVLLDLLTKEKLALSKLNILEALQKLTGHYFEPDPEIWKQWHKIVGGQVIYIPPKMDRAKNRKRVKNIQDLGVSSRTESAVEYGLLWLSRHQGVNGEWNGSTYHRLCIDGKACQADGGHRDRPLAYTALAILCYQGAGYTHLEGPYRDVIQRGYEFILANQDYDGSHNEKSWTFSYESAVLCQALCDGYMLTGDKWLGDAAQRMIDYLVKVQYPGLAWRYAVRSKATDTSIMSWILLASISARTAGLDIPEQIFVASEKWMDGACDPVPAGEFEVFHADAYKPKNTYFIDVSRDKKGKLRHFKIKTWYQPPRLYTPAMSSIGLLTRIWMGWTRAHPFCIGAANQVMSQIPGYNKGLEGDYAFYPYTWYYGSLASYQMGGRYWTRWKDTCIKDLLPAQKLSGCELGSWPMPKKQFFGGLTGGTVYATCMAVLTLETFYRYQPYLARTPLRALSEDEAKARRDAKEAAAKKRGPSKPPAQK